MDEFTQAVQYLNQTLPMDKKIIYIAWDMARASKSEKEDVIGTLEQIAERVLATTGFFHSGFKPSMDELHKRLEESCFLLNFYYSRSTLNTSAHFMKT